MTIGIVGLGLIGGSFAKTYADAGWNVLAIDTDNTTFRLAKETGAVHGKLNKDNISECDLVLICVYPGAAINFMRKMGPRFGAKPLVIDCCGTKRFIFSEGSKISDEFGFAYIGGHPMAGTQYSGFKYSRANLFHNAPMVLVPKDINDKALINSAVELLKPAEFAKYSITTAEDHDRIIAFTSQLAHVAANAYVKSPAALSHKGFSAGSYKDMTRVAWLNPQMWAELFMDNRDFLIEELDIYIKNLNEYKIAMQQNNEEKLIELLAEGKLLKEQIDGR